MASRRLKVIGATALFAGLVVLGWAIFGRPPTITEARCSGAIEPDRAWSLEARPLSRWSRGESVQLWPGGRFEVREPDSGPEAVALVRQRDGCADVVGVRELFAEATAAHATTPWNALTDGAPDLVDSDDGAVFGLVLRRSGPQPEAFVTAARSPALRSIADRLRALVRDDEEITGSMGEFADRFDDRRLEVRCNTASGRWCAWTYRETHDAPTHADPRGVAYQLLADGRWRCATRRYEHFTRGRIAPEQARAALDWLRRGTWGLPSLGAAERPGAFDPQRIASVRRGGGEPETLDQRAAQGTLARWLPLAGQLSPYCLPASSSPQ